MTLEEAINYYLPILQREFYNVKYGKVLFFPDDIAVRERKFFSWLYVNYNLEITTNVQGGYLIAFITSVAQDNFLQQAEQQKTMDLLKK